MEKELKKTVNQHGEKARLKKEVRGNGKKDTWRKKMQSEIFRKQDESCNLWLRQNLTPRKTVMVMTMLEQMVETKAWEPSRRLECSKCRLCGQQKE